MAATDAIKVTAAVLGSPSVSLCLSLSERIGRIGQTVDQTRTDGAAGRGEFRGTCVHGMGWIDGTAMERRCPSPCT